MKKLKTRLLLALALLPSFAMAMNYSGRLVNSNGSPVSGTVDLKIDLSYSGNPTVVVCTKDFSNVPLVKGVFDVELNYSTGDCGGQTLQHVLLSTPAGESLLYRVTDETHAKVYSFQAIHSVPSSIMATMAKTMDRMGANVGQVISWNGTRWAPGHAGGGDGSVTEVQTGSGLTGGPITETGTIAIAAGGVADTHLANSFILDSKFNTSAAIDRSKFASGSPSHIVVNDSSGRVVDLSLLPIGSGGTGANSVPGARTALGLGTAALANVGFNSGEVLPAKDLTSCGAGFKLNITLLPVKAWTCVPEDEDLTKLPLAGGTMQGPINMGSFKITNLATPTSAAEAANKAYVDILIPGTTIWTANGSDIYRNGGEVGIGTSLPAAILDISSTSSGFLIPRMTEAERDLIASPSKGMILFNTTSSLINFYDGGWKALGTAGMGLQSLSIGAGLTPQGSITSTGSIAVDVGTGPNQIVQLNGSAKIPAVDGSALTNLNPLELSSALSVSHGGTGLTAAGAANQVFGTNAAGTAVEYKTISPGTGVSVSHGANTVTISVTGAPPTGAASGDLSGNYPSPDVVALKGTPVSGAASVAGQTILFDGTSYSPTSLSGDATLSGTGVFTLNTVPTSKGGTGVTALTAKGIVKVNGSGNGFVSLTCATDQYLLFNSSGVAVCSNTSAITAASFVQNGNSFGAPATVGSNDAESVQIETNNSPRITILADGKVGIGTTTPTSILEIASTTSGLLVPRMTTAERNAIASPVKGMQIYNTTTDAINFYDGAWKALGVAGSGVQSITVGSGLTPTGSITNTGAIAVDTGTTANKILQVDGSDKIPAVDASLVTDLTPANISGVVPIAKGGTALSALGSSNQILGVNSAATSLEYKTVTAGSGITVVQTPNTVTVTATGGAPTGTAAGDLSGTYPNPTVAKLQGSAISATAATSGQIYVYNSATWTPTSLSSDATLSNTGALTLGTIPISKGGTNATSFTAKGIVSVNPAGTGLISTACTNNQFLLFNSSGVPVCSNLSSVTATSFIQNGNSFGATAVVGTSDAFGMAFETSGLTRLTVDVNGNVGIGGTPSSILDIASTSSGILIPRMTTLQRNAIASPVVGMQIFNTTTNTINFYDGAWKEFKVSGTGVTSITIGSGLTPTGAFTSGSIALDTGTTANKIIQLDGSAKIPAVDGSALTNLNPNSLSGVVPVSKGGTGLSTAGAANQVIGVNNAATALEYKSILGASPITVSQGANSVAIDLGTVPVSHGGTGLTTTTANRVLTTDLSGAYQFLGCSPGETISFNATLELVCQTAGVPAFAFTPGGNSFAASATLGTNDSNPLVIEVGNAASMTILADGSTGIGTSGPATKLDVAGEIKVGNSSLACNGTIEGSVRFNSSGNKMEMCNGTSWVNIAKNFISSISIGAPSTPLVKAGPVTFSVAYGSGTEASSITLNSSQISFGGAGASGCTSSVSGSGLTRTITVNNCAGTGPVSISIAAGSATSLSGETALSAGPSSTFQADNTGPSATTITLGTVPTTMSQTPTVTYSASVDVGGSTTSYHQIKIIKTSDSSLISDWSTHTSGTAKTGLTLSANTQYSVLIRGVDNFGNFGTAATANWNTPSELFAFSTHTFTPCSQTGAYGPNISQCQSAYSGTTWASTSSFFSMPLQGYQMWTVPKTATYRITVAGATGLSGGQGAVMRGDFTLNQGDKLLMVVGQRATGSSYSGGGGSFVTLGSDYTTSTPLIIAGGGSTTYNSSGYINAVTTTNGNSGYGQGGINGNGGAGSYHGGGGFLTNGTGAYGSGIGNGKSFRNGAVGGTETACGGNYGGFGGGGGGCPGGGGGYSGGDGTSAGGGGSYNTGTNQYNYVGNTADGYITIKWIDPANPPPTPTFATGRISTNSRRIVFVQIPSGTAINTNADYKNACESMGFDQNMNYSNNSAYTNANMSNSSKYYCSSHCCYLGGGNSMASSINSYANAGLTTGTYYRVFDRGCGDYSSGSFTTSLNTTDALYFNGSTFSYSASYFGGANYNVAKSPVTDANTLIVCQEP